MPSSLSSLIGRAQSIKAQTLATLMSSLGEVQAVAATAANEADNPQASLQATEAAVKATLIAVDAEGKAILDVAGNRIEAQLPPDLLKAAARNPDLLRPGTTLRLPSDVPARILSPATRVDIQGQGLGSSVGPALQLASPFPPGSLGAAIAKLAGIALPGAEAQVTGALAEGMPPLPAAAPALRAGMITQIVQPEILTALVQASGRQVSLAQAMNFLLSLPPEALKSLPDGVQAALKALGGLRAAPGDLATTEGLQKAVSTSGLFLEANLAQPGQGAPAPDLKTLLLGLKAMLGTPAQPLTLPGSLSGGGLANAAALLLGDATPAPDPSPATRHASPPPAQAAPQTPNLGEVQRAVDGAIERIKLSQLASLPEHPDIKVTDDRIQPMRLALSLPLATQGHDRAATAAMGLVIEHRPSIEKPKPYEMQDEGESPETTGFPWKVRIAVDLEETGPVQAEIALRGQSVGVTLWAERKSMAEAARREIGDLHKALTGAAFEVVNLEVKDGFPHQRPVVGGPVLDRRT